MSRQFSILRIAALCVLAGTVAPMSVTAQTTTSSASNPGGPMVIEQEHLRLAIAPEYKVSKFDGSSAQLAGAYGGWFIGNSVLVGGGLYTLTNGSRGRGLTYGGAVVGWQPWSGKWLGVNLRGLVGPGRATVSDTITFADRDAHDLFRNARVLASTVSPTTVTVARSSDVFVAESQADLLFRLTTHLHLDIGGGYRLVSGSRISDDRVRGATGGISLRIGSAQ